MSPKRGGHFQNEINVPTMDFQGTGGVAYFWHLLEPWSSSHVMFFFVWLGPLHSGSFRNCCRKLGRPKICGTSTVCGMSFYQRFFLRWHIQIAYLKQIKWASRHPRFHSQRIWTQVLDHHLSPINKNRPKQCARKTSSMKQKQPKKKTIDP